MKRFLAALILCAISVRAGVIIDTPCTDAAIRVACLNASEGDTVAIRVGDCTITNLININRNVSFNVVGAGTNLTTIRSANIANPFRISSTSTNTMTWSDMSWVGSTGNTLGFMQHGVSTPGDPMKGLVHFTRLNLFIPYVGMQVGYWDSPVLIDYCYFAVTNTPAKPYNALKTYGNSWFSWLTNGNQLGSIHNTVFVENCTFKKLSVGVDVGDGFLDGYNGGSLVLRYNLFDGDTALGVHGYDSQITAFKSCEVYNNTFTNTDTHLYVNRGGAWLFYSNEVWSIHPSTQPNFLVSPYITYYRSTFGAPSGTPLFNWYDGFAKTNYYATTNDMAGSGKVQGYTIASAAQIAATPNFSGLILLGSNVQETLVHASAALNGDLSKTALGWWTRVTTNPYPTGKIPNPDFTGGVDPDGHTLRMTNRLDGPTTFAGSQTGNGYRAAFGPGQLTQNYATNTGTFYGNYSWSNRWHWSDGVITNLGFDLNPSINGPMAPYGTNFTPQLIQLNREYFNDTPAPGYTNFTFPYPGGTPPPSPPGQVKYYPTGVRRRGI